MAADDGMETGHRLFYAIAPDGPIDPDKFMRRIAAAVASLVEVAEQKGLVTERDLAMMYPRLDGMKWPQTTAARG